MRRTRATSSTAASEKERLTTGPIYEENPKRCGLIGRGGSTLSAALATASSAAEISTLAIAAGGCLGETESVPKVTSLFETPSAAPGCRVTFPSRGAEGQP